MHHFPKRSSIKQYHAKYWNYSCQYPILKITDNSLTIKLQTRTTYPYLNKGKGSHSKFYKTIKNISNYLQ